MELTSVILGFTADDQLVLGLSIDDEGMRPENETKAKDLLHRLAEQYGCHLGLVTVEEPPPRDESAFRAAEGQPLTVSFKGFRRTR